MRSIWINASPFDPFGVEAIWRFVPPDYIRDYSNWCPPGTVRGRSMVRRWNRVLEGACF